MTEAPSNVAEFNQIAGLIFAQLYEAFPVAEDINRARLAEAMERTGRIGRHMCCHRAVRSTRWSRTQSAG